MRSHTKGRAILERVLVWVAALAIPVLPRWVILGMARRLGWCAFRFSKRYRDRSLANLDLVFGDTITTGQKRRTAEASFRSFRGTPPASVVASLGSPAADRMLSRIRWVTGQRVVPKKGAVREMFRTLRHGDRIAILIDQNLLPEDGGSFVHFLGRPVPVSPVVDILVRKTGACAPGFLHATARRDLLGSCRPGD